MAMSQTIRMFTRYKAWADDLIYGAVADLPDGEALKERPTLFKSMAHTLNHIYVIDLVWQGHLLGRTHPFTARNTPTHPPLDELWPAQQAIDAWYVDYGDSLSKAALEEMVDYTFIGGGPGATSRRDILLHIVNHATYHRGFVADMLFQVPVQPPTTDLPVFLRDAAGGDFA